MVIQKKRQAVIAALGGMGLCLLLMTGISFADSPSVPSGIVRIEIAPRAVDPTDAAQSVAVAVHLAAETDAATSEHATPAQAIFMSPSGQQTAYLLFDAVETLEQEQATHHIYRGRLTLPQYSEAGVWQLRRLVLMDAQGVRTTLSQSDVESLDLTISFRVNTDKSDTTAPHLTGFTLTPQLVHLPSPPIVLTLHITDDLSGVTDGLVGGIGRIPTQARFSSPSGEQTADILLTPGDLIEGTVLDGTYEGSFTLPQESETGFWRLQHLLIVDEVGNQRWLRGEELEEFDAPLGFEVRPPTTQRIPLPTEDEQP